MFECITFDWNFFFTYLSGIGTFVICLTTVFGVLSWKQKIWLSQKIEVINDSMKNRDICYNAAAPLANILEGCFRPYLKGYEINFSEMDFTLMRKRIFSFIEKDHNIEELKNAILNLKILSNKIKALKIQHHKELSELINLHNKQADTIVSIIESAKLDEKDFDENLFMDRVQTFRSYNFSGGLNKTTTDLQVKLNEAYTDILK